MKLIIEGEKKVIESIRTRNRLIEKKGLISQTIESTDFTNLSAEETISLIDMYKTENDLKLFEDDKRKTVKQALKRRKSELGL